MIHRMATAAKPQRSQAAGRDEHGKFLPGRSGNPGGKTKGLAAKVRELMPEDELIAGMVKIAKGQKIAGQKPTIAEIIRAREWLAERGHGKAPAFAPIEGENPLELDDVTREVAEALDELAARREAHVPRSGEARAVADASEG